MGVGVVGVGRGVGAWVLKAAAVCGREGSGAAAHGCAGGCSRLHAPPPRIPRPLQPAQRCELRRAPLCLALPGPAPCRSIPPACATSPARALALLLLAPCRWAWAPP